MSSALSNKSLSDLYNALKFFKDNNLYNYMFVYLCKVIYHNKIFSFDLAKCYLYGYGTEVDYRLASYYFTVSKKCGDKYYFKYLILCYVLLQQHNDIINTIKDYNKNYTDIKDILKNISEKFYNDGDKYFSIIIDNYISTL